MAASFDVSLGKVLAALGARLRTLRSQHRLTLEQLSKLSKLSEPYLSRLESGSRQPTLGVLLTLAQIYRMSLRGLLDAEEEQVSRCAIFRRGLPTSEANGLKYRAISGAGTLPAMQALQVTIPVHRPQQSFSQHDGEEWIYVLGGQLRLIFEAEEHLLNLGDAAHFDAAMPHRLAASGRRAAEVLIVAAGGHHPQVPNSALIAIGAGGGIDSH